MDPSHTCSGAQLRSRCSVESSFLATCQGCDSEAQGVSPRVPLSDPCALSPQLTHTSHPAHKEPRGLGLIFCGTEFAHLFGAFPGHSPWGAACGPITHTTSPFPRGRRAAFVHSGLPKTSPSHNFTPSDLSKDAEGHGGAGPEFLRMSIQQAPLRCGRQGCQNCQRAGSPGSLS